MIQSGLGLKYEYWFCVVTSSLQFGAIDHPKINSESFITIKSDNTLELTTRLAYLVSLDSFRLTNQISRNFGMWTRMGPKRLGNWWVALNPRYCCRWHPRISQGRIYCRLFWTYSYVSPSSLAFFDYYPASSQLWLLLATSSYSKATHPVICNLLPTRNYEDRVSSHLTPTSID